MRRIDVFVYTIIALFLLMRALTGLDLLDVVFSVVLLLLLVFARRIGGGVENNQ